MVRRGVIRLVAPALLATACGAPRRPAEHALDVPPLAASPGAETASVSGGDLPTLTVPEEIDVACWPSSGCVAPLAFTIDNPTDDEWLLTSFGAGNAGFEPEDPWRIRPHTRFTRAVPRAGARQLGSFSLRVTLERAHGAALTLSSTYAIVDVAKERAIAECKAHGNEWGHTGGMIRREGCAEVMPDKGKTCHDARDCKGVCVQTSRRPHSKTMDLVTGTCSVHAYQYGCHSRIGETDHGLIPRGSHYAHVCVD